MAMRVLRHRRRTDGTYQLQVWDTTKTLNDGQTPDPAFVWSFEFGTKPGALTANQYAQAMLAETKALLQEQRADRNANATVLQSEGTDL